MTMTIDAELEATDLFCGAGGSSWGAQLAGLKLRMAANHWQTAIDVHQHHFPDAGHDCADISQADPRRYPRTPVLLASPECTNHSQARGISRKKQDPSLWDAPDPMAERSRATMWDVCRFAEQMLYEVIVVENVVEATKWVGWRAWHTMMADLGYEHRVLSINSMHHRVPQSRDRIYVVFWRKGIDLDLTLKAPAWCPRCDLEVLAEQAWKPGRSVGRYRQQWEWACTACAATCEPPVRGAAEIIDWELACQRIGDRPRPLATNTRARIRAGLERYGWVPVITAGAGHTHERTPGNRAHPLGDPLPVQHSTPQHALATPPGWEPEHGAGSADDRHGPRPGFLVQNAHGGPHVQSRVSALDEPTRAQAAKAGEGIVCPPFMVKNYGDASEAKYRPHPVTDPIGSVTCHPSEALVVPLRTHGVVTPAEDPTRTVTAGNGGGGQGLLMRNNLGGAEMVTPTEEPARTLTSKGHQSLIVPYYGTRSEAYPPDVQPLGTVRGHDSAGLLLPPWEPTDAEIEAFIDDCGFRMLAPHEIAAAMGFPVGYIPADLTKGVQVKLAGNAVTPPVMQWIAARIVAALGG